jgi:hypothetical protein
MSDDFYVGYQPKAPNSLAKRGKRTAIATILLGCSASALLILGQPRFAASRFEFGTYREYIGAVEEWPYPTLVTDYQTLLLVDVGKHGLSEAVRGWQGKHVRLRGSLIERGPDRMVEVLPGSLEEISQGSATLARPIRSLGSAVLRGEIVDSKCYLGVMNPGEKKVHRDCAVRCISGGVPPAFVARDATGDVRILLLTGRNGRALRREILPFVAEPLEIPGEIIRVGSTLVLRAEPSDFRPITE